MSGLIAVSLVVGPFIDGSEDSTAATPTTTAAAVALGDDSRDTTTTSEVLPHDDSGASLIAYDLVEEEDMSYPGVTRVSLRVTVEAGATPQQLSVLAHHLADQYRESHQYQAFNIFFYHYPELAYDYASVGIWIDAPFGNWSRAGEVSRGDYSTFEIDERLYNKDWSLLPSRAEVDLYVAFNAKFAELDTHPVDFPDEADVAAAVAAELGITAEDVLEALSAVFMWQFSGR